LRFRSLSQHQAHGSTTNGSVTNSVRAPGAVLAGTRPAKSVGGHCPQVKLASQGAMATGLGGQPPKEVQRFGAITVALAGDQVLY